MALKPLRTAVRRYRRLLLRLRLGSRLTIGENVYIGAGARFAAGEFIRIGTNVGIARDFHCEASLEIGDDVLISSRVAVIARDHTFDDPTRTVFWSGRQTPGTVTIEGDNLIGFGTIIIAPARIGRGAIVGAGSVVTHDLPSGMVCAGVPARALRPRYPDRDLPRRQ